MSIILGRKKPKNQIINYQQNARVYQIDALKFLGNKQDRSIDLIVTDPPYESLEKHRKRGTTTRLKHSKASSNDWFEVFPNKKFKALFCEFYRVLAKNSHLYVFCDQETMFHMVPVAESAGFKFWKFLVWEKSRLGMGYHYRAKHELILFFEKGKRKLNDLSIPDVLYADPVYRKYPAQKPVALVKTLIHQSSHPGELVCDPFVGSGTTAVASLVQHRKFIGCDISKKSISSTNDRIKNLGVENDKHRRSETKKT